MTSFDQDETLNALRDALQLSPDNAVLRGQFAKMLITRGKLDEAEQILTEGLRNAPQSEQLQISLAECYRKLGKSSAALVIVEELISKPQCPPAIYVLRSRLLLAQGDFEGAGRAYRKAVQIDPRLSDADLDEAFSVSSENQETGYYEENPEVDDLGRIRQSAEPVEDNEPLIKMEKPDIDFSAVGGMEDLKEQIRLKIIEPLKHPEIYKAYGKAVGGSILMYGPPGCGKTYLAKATAGEVDAGFMPVGIHDVLDMWYGNSEQKLHSLFENAREHAPCVLFFDEVDALGASRADMRQSAGRVLINQFLSELDGIDNSNDGVLILAATNAPWQLDPAFRRPGRFDRMLFVPPPDEPARASILRVMLAEKPTQDVDYDTIARKTPKFSGADIMGMIDVAIEKKLRDAMKAGVPSPLTTKDLLKAAKSVKASTLPWFASARNYALYSNEGGAYDDIADYLKLK
jgi:transitional endoplasmic reticulum ATPase